MGYRGKEYKINDFKGGLHSNSATTELNLNEALDLSNIIISSDGSYWRTRGGNTVFNSTAMNSGTNVQGLGYFRTAANAEYLTAVCGNKIFASTSLNGTMTDITGAVTVTGSAANIWTLLTFNNVHIGFGGPSTAPDAPWSWTGAGNAAALGGTPPSAYGAFQVNNRVFAFNTAANPSRIFWSILGSQSDWTGTGSGNADVWTSNNDSLTAAAILDTNTVLLFKQNSIHKMIVGTLVSNAFPIFPAINGIGCVGKHACVEADGLVYFITPQASMVVTNGDIIIGETNLPRLSFIDDIFAGLNTTRLEYIQGKRIIGNDYDHIIWLVSSSGSSTNDKALIWDLKNKCWLQNKTGFKANVITTIQNGTLYTGHYDGKIYLQEVTTAVTDASESSANIDYYWRSGWMKMSSMEKIIQPRKSTVSLVSQISGTVKYSYGFDFNMDTQTIPISQSGPDTGNLWDASLWDSGVWGGQSDLIIQFRMSGRGNVFQYMLRGNDYKSKINSIEFSGKEYGQKAFIAR